MFWKKNSQKIFHLSSIPQLFLSKTHPNVISRHFFLSLSLPPSLQSNLFPVYIKFHQAQQQGSPLSIILNVTDNVKNAASLERNLRRIHHASGNLAAGFTAKQILHRTGEYLHRFARNNGRIPRFSSISLWIVVSTNLNTLNHLQFLCERNLCRNCIFYYLIINSTGIG